MKPTMALEIERKFLVKNSDYKRLAEAVFYQQGYLSNNEKSVVRIRIAGDKGFVTIKEQSVGLSRQEFEYEIPRNDARTLLDQLCEQPTIRKKRYKIPFNSLIWGVDEIDDNNEGLIIAEVELISEDQSFEKPPWVGEEVTGDARYYNVNLIKNPFNKW